MRERPLSEPTVHKVTVQLRPATPPDDPGQITYGYFTLVDGLLTVVDGDGRPPLDDFGHPYTHHVGPAENPNAIAAVLVRKIRAKLHGEGAGFNRPLQYRAAGVV